MCAQARLSLSRVLRSVAASVIAQASAAGSATTHVRCAVRAHLTAPFQTAPLPGSVNCGHALGKGSYHGRYRDTSRTSRQRDGLIEALLDPEHPRSLCARSGAHHGPRRTAGRFTSPAAPVGAVLTGTLVMRPAPTAYHRSLAAVSGIRCLRGPVALRRLDRGTGGRVASANADQVQRQRRGSRPDRSPGRTTALRVREHRRDRDPPASTDPHSDHALIPTSDDLALAQPELERARSTDASISCPSSMRRRRNAPRRCAPRRRYHHRRRRCPRSPAGTTAPDRTAPRRVSSHPSSRP